MDCLRTSAVLLSSIVASCVVSEPIGTDPEQENPPPGESDGDVERPPEGEDAGACITEPQEHFEWEWSLGSYEPVGDPDANYYESDSLLPLDCEVASWDEDDDALNMVLNCEVDGAPIPTQSLMLSPKPEVLLSELNAEVPFSLTFRPQQTCPNGCFVGGGGWLAVRRSEDEELLVGIADVSYLSEPVEELLPLVVTVEDDATCPRIFDEDVGCETPGWVQARRLSVGTPEVQAAILGAGVTGWSEYDVLVNQAVAGMFDTCTFDAGERGHVSVMLVKLLE